MLIFISSTNAEDKYPDNEWYDFTISLPTDLYFSRQERWEMALMQIIIVRDTSKKLETQMKKQYNEPIYLMCDALESSIVNQSWEPVLGTTSLNDCYNAMTYFEKPYYVKLCKERLSDVRLYLKMGNRQLLPFQEATTWCALHIRKSE